MTISLHGRPVNQIFVGNFLELGYRALNKDELIIAADAAQDEARRVYIDAVPIVMPYRRLIGRR
jgi:hypothetical protein